MGASTFQPPIHLDPTQDQGQQTAFINQNFQAIAATLETNSFRIVDDGVVAVSSNGATASWSTYAHNLGFAPIPFAYLTNVNLSGITSAGNIPLPTFTNLNIDTLKSTALNGGVACPIDIFGTWMEAVADETNLYVVLYNATGSAIGPLDVQFYLVQQPAG